MKISNFFILYIKNIKFLMRNTTIIFSIIVFHMIQLIVIRNVYENFIGTYEGNSINFTEIKVLGQINTIDPMVFFAASVLVQLIFFIAIITTSIMVLEKENNTLKRIMLSPVSKIQIITSSFLANISSIITLSFIYILLTKIIYSVNWGNSWLSLFVATFIVSSVSSALSMSIFSIFNSTKLAASIISFIVIIMVFISGSISAGMQYNHVSKFTFNKWALDLYIDIMQGKSLVHSTLNIFILSISALVLITISIIIFRRDKSLE